MLIIIKGYQFGKICQHNFTELSYLPTPVPNMWYQKDMHPEEVVGLNWGLTNQALSPATLGAEVSMNM